MLDLTLLEKTYNEVNEYFSEDVFILVLAPNNVTYALLIDDIQILIDKLEADMQNVDFSSDDEKLDYLMEEMAEKYENSTNLEQTFLELYGDYGISLYEATDANLNNWKKLELDSNDNETVTESICN